MNADYDTLSSSPYAHQQQANNDCSFLFIQPSSLTSACNSGFGNCQEPAVWCWPQTCSLGSDEFVSCSVNGTSHFCVCSSLPPAFESETEDDTSSSLVTSPSIGLSTWRSSPTSPTSVTSPMSTWFSTGHSSSSGQHNIIEGTDPSGSTGEQSISPNDGLPIGAIIAIVVVSFLVALALIALSVWSVMKLKRKRKLEGKYCPAVEEQKSSANTLPPLPLPAPEGLI